jgi:hypothetical protein
MIFLFDVKRILCALESTQKGSLDVSQWMVWYFECLTTALVAIVIEKGILSDSGF